ncbi:MAG: hypothetical protein HYX84_02820 [Chloroflexi bacterium]|nr:hypothetical protein [Chloroflexota bacterium]
MDNYSSSARPRLLVRDVRPDEVEAVSQLLKDAYQEYEHYITPEVWKTYLDDVMDVRSRLPTAELIIAELDGKLAGAVTLYLNASRSTGDGWLEGWAGRGYACSPCIRHTLAVAFRRAVSSSLDCVSCSRRLRASSNLTATLGFCRIRRSIS